MFDNKTVQSYTFTSYLKSRQAIWYWIVIAIELLTLTLTFSFSGSTGVLLYARNVFGIVFVLFLPGYAFIRTPLLNNLFSKKSERSLAWIEKLAFSIAISIIVVSMITLILYYSPLDLNQITMFFSFFIFTTVFSTFSVVSEYRTERS